MERARIFITACRSCLPWFFKKKITITFNTFLHKPGRKITSSGNGMCREGVIQVDDYGTSILSKHMCPLNVMLPSFLHPVPSHSKIFVFKVRSHLQWPVAEQRQEEEFHGFKELNGWAVSGCSRKPTCLDAKTWEKVTLLCPTVNWHHVLQLWRAKMGVMIVHLNLLSFSGICPTLLWIFLIDGPVHRKSELSLAKDLASWRLPAFFWIN